MLTPAVIRLSVKLLGYQINTVALRLMPHLFNRVADYETMDRRHLSDDDLIILDAWNEKGYIEFDKDCPATQIPITISRDFYNALTEFIWVAYVQVKMEPDPVEKVSTGLDLSKPVIYEIAATSMIKYPGEVFFPVGHEND